MLDENLQPLLAQFPNRYDEIAQRFACDATFREICWDYLELHRMIVRLHEAPRDAAERMLADYTNTLVELEAELRLVLNYPPQAQDHPIVSQEKENHDDCTDVAEGP